MALPGANAKVEGALAGPTPVGSAGASLVLGLALSVASTVVLLRALEERNALDTVNGPRDVRRGCNRGGEQE